MSSGGSKCESLQGRPWLAVNTAAERLRERQATLKAQGCTCPGKRGERCTRDWIRCESRRQWFIANVWQIKDADRD